MPLETGKSKEAFSHNVETEMNAGKAQKQAVAIAYSEKGRNDAGSETLAKLTRMCDAVDSLEARMDVYEGRVGGEGCGVPVRVDAIQITGLDEMRAALGRYERARSAYSKAADGEERKCTGRELDVAREAYEKAKVYYEENKGK